MNEVKTEQTNNAAARFLTYPPEIEERRVQHERQARALYELFQV